MKNSSIVLPMLASPTSAAGNRRPVCFEDLMKTGDWVADTKIDGVRALVMWNGDQVLIRNRGGVDITARYPEVAMTMGELLKGRPEVMVDGEIVAKDGRFETTLLRDQQQSPRRIAAMVTQHPVVFIAFDLPMFRTPWEERRHLLETMALEWDTPSVSTTVVSFSEDFLVTTRKLGMEGVVAKHIRSRYEFGRRSKQWLKFRNRYRVSCLVAGYHPGTGSRSEFGAMELALLDEAGTPVSVGRVGTGFSGSEIPRLKEALDRGDLLVVEIETTNQTKGGQLRFPVYKGIRTDVAPTDCLLAQLQYLPTC